MKKWIIDPHVKEIECEPMNFPDHAIYKDQLVKIYDTLYAAMIEVENKIWNWEFTKKEAEKNWPDWR